MEIRLIQSCVLKTFLMMKTEAQAKARECNFHSSTFFTFQVLRKPWFEVQQYWVLTPDSTL